MTFCITPDILTQLKMEKSNKSKKITLSATIHMRSKVDFEGLKNNHGLQKNGRIYQMLKHGPITNGDYSFLVRNGKLTNPAKWLLLACDLNFDFLTLCVLVRAFSLHLAFEKKKIFTTHPLLERACAELIRTEVRGSMEDLVRELEDVTTIPPVFAYPSGSTSDEARRLLAELGMELVFTTERGINNIENDDPLALRRINVGLGTRWPLLRLQLAGIPRRN